MGSIEAAENATWRRSDACTGADATCVEVLIADHAVAVRNSRHVDGPTLCFTTVEWLAFLRGVRAGEFDPA